MPAYQSRGCTVEAIRFDGTRECWERNFARHGYLMTLRTIDEVELVIEVNSGGTAFEGDWIVNVVGTAVWFALARQAFSALFREVK